MASLSEQTTASKSPGTSLGTSPGSGKTSTWAVLAPFFHDDGAVWLDDFVQDERLTFKKVRRRGQDPSWHMSKSRLTGLGNWRRHIDQAWRALSMRPDGIVTSFPHLAFCVGLLKRVRRSRIPVVAYTFNLGAFHGGAKQALARFAARGIDRFVVHAPSEVQSYAAYLGRPESAFTFVPLQRGAPGVTRDEDHEAPFILSMGSAHRDYDALIKAVAARAIPTVIVTRPDIIDTLPKAPHLTYKSGLSQSDCEALLARARLSVTPISNQTTASGQITFINAMQLGVPTIATSCPGTEGYIDPGRTGILVEPGDAGSLEAAITGLWDNAEERARLSEASRIEADARFSDAAAAEQLRRLIHSLA